MKKYLILFIILNLTSGAWAYTGYFCSEVATCASFYVQGGGNQKVSTVPDATMYQLNCAAVSNMFYVQYVQNSPGCVWIPTCLQCKSGYKLVEYDSVFFGNMDYACTSFDYNTPKYCTKIDSGGDTNPDENCVSDTNWTDAQQGYEKRTNRTWNGTTCVVTVEYRCAADWYGTPVVNGTSFSGCNHCPMEMVGDGVWAEITSAPGSTIAEMCYLVKEYTSSDFTGEFIQYPPCGYNSNL